MGAENPMGNHPSTTPNTMSMSSATQKVGLAAKTKQKAFTNRSAAPPRRTPAAMPRASPSTPLASHAMPMSTSEFAAR